VIAGGTNSTATNAAAMTPTSVQPILRLYLGLIAIFSLPLVF
jgi:hypothetical protein